ncbi:MAG: hypothetical protein GY870_00795 [archaeon]|nr:hypothetical protein [archaeon]
MAKRILRIRKGELVKDPVEALQIFLNETKEYYSTEILDISKISDEDLKYDKLEIKMAMSCFYRNSLKKRPKLKIGGPLCRVNKAYFEVGLKKITGLKCEVNFIENMKKDECCIETVTFFIPK